MCTAISLSNQSHYFGRNLDLEYAYKETVVITPKNFPLTFRHQKELSIHYALIGMAYIYDNYPLYYDATNEAGLSMAGLNFPNYAYYFPYRSSSDNITPFELIPWVLGQCQTVGEACLLLEKTNIIAEAFHLELPLSPLHWIISDADHSLTVESTKKGLSVYPNPVGVLTNSPTFDMQLFHLNNYMNLSNATPLNRFSKKLVFKPYSNGMGALGMPGDWSSQSRFVKAVFLNENAVCESNEEDTISQFFHILDCVAHPRGCVAMNPTTESHPHRNSVSRHAHTANPDSTQYEITLYSSCCNTTKGIYYYKTFHNNQISAVDLHKENLDGTALISYPLQTKQQIFWQN